MCNKISYHVLYDYNKPLLPTEKSSRCCVQSLYELLELPLLVKIKLGPSDQADGAT